MPKTKKVIAVLDLLPRRAHAKTRSSFQAAAERWDARLLWIDKPLHNCHPWWQKLMVCQHVVKQLGHCQLLQLDNDMLIRDDCPSPFDRVDRKQFGIVAGRQGMFHRLGRDSWAHRVHHVWARRTGTKAAPPWMHPNGGFYLYHTEAFTPMFERIVSHGPKSKFDKRFGCDESLIVNHLWDLHLSQICYLPSEFNTLLHHNPQLAAHKAMSTFVYHFVAHSKRHLPGTWWRLGKHPALPIPSGKHAQEV